jgi:hypothetical protein
MTNINAVPDDWALYTGIWGNNLPILLRIRNGLEEHIGSPRYPQRYMLTWTYSEPRDDGFPSGLDMDAMEEFENRIFDTLEADQHSICVATITNCGERDWIFYTADSNETNARLNQSLQGAPRYPIQPMASPDPEWKEFCGIMANAQSLGDDTGPVVGVSWLKRLLRYFLRPKGK